jgi:hypothetical protein
MFSYSHPRESLNLPWDLHEGRALVPMDHGDPQLRAAYQRYGMVLLTPLAWTGEINLGKRKLDVVVSLDPDSPYYKALGNIYDAEEVCKIPNGSYRDAYQSLVNGTFEETPWVEYLPTEA